MTALMTVRFTLIALIQRCFTSETDETRNDRRTKGVHYAVLYCVPAGGARLQVPQPSEVW